MNTGGAEDLTIGDQITKNLTGSNSLDVKTAAAQTPKVVGNT